MPSTFSPTWTASRSPGARIQIRRRSAWVSVLFGLSLPLALIACDPGFPGPGQGETISEEVFVETLVELRRAAAHWERRHIPVEERDSILAARNLTPEDLLEFVEIHGTDVLYMNQIWTRVEARLTHRNVDSLQADVPEAADLVEEGLLPRGAVPELPDDPDPRPEG